MTSFRLNRLLKIAGAVFLAGIFFLAQKFEAASGGDPDRYYHFALSRSVVESGRAYLRQLPQIEGLGWDRFFAEKEFLFHLLTAQGYRLAGDKGVVAAVWCLGLIGLLIFYFYSARRRGPLLALAITGLFFGSPMLLSRLILVRPHVLAISCFVAMLAAALSRRWIFFFLATLVFTLSYHAFYIPVIVMAAALAAQYLSGEEMAGQKKLFFSGGLFGLLAGILLNPYFPSNLVSGFQIAYIPALMAGKLSYVGFGMELYPTASNSFLMSLFLPLSVFLLSVWQVSRERYRGELRYPTLLLTLVALACLWLSFQSRRGAEYFVPVSAFLFVEIWGGIELLRVKRARMAVYALMTGILLSHGWVYFQEMRQGPGERVENALSAAASLPAEGAFKVFNCEWDTTPYLYYTRPNLRFLDILDPSLLYFSNEEAHNARERLKRAESADAYGLLKNAFKADYVYCRDMNVISILDRDPRFRRIYPADRLAPVGDFTVFVYELRDKPGIRYASQYELSFVPVKEKDFRSADPSAAEKSIRSEKLTYTSYLDLGAVFKSRIHSLKGDQALCARVKPADMSELAGAAYLTLGGGRNIRIWLNGNPWFQSEYAYLQASMHQQIVQLPKPLRGSDLLEFVVCSARSSNFWGFSVAGLTEQSFRETCKWKREREMKPLNPISFPQGRTRQSCIGAFALPALSPDLH